MKSRLIIRDGHQQLQRHLPALRGDYFQPNEMRFEALLTLASEYAGMMRFYQLDLTQDGDWHQYFHADETILLATVLAFETKDLNDKFEARLRHQSTIALWATPDSHFSIERGDRGVINSPLLLARLLDYWLVSASSMPGRAALELQQLILGVLRGLHWEMQALLHFSGGGKANFASALFSPQFLHTVGWNPASKLASEAHHVSEKTLGEFKHYFHALSQALRMVQQSALRLMPESRLSGEHDPASSLLITFIELFQKLLSRLNRFGDRHLDFYYQDVLRMSPKVQQTDSAYLVIRPLASAKKIDIVKGAAFVANSAETEDEFIFEAAQDSVLNDAKVVALHTLFFEHGEASTAKPSETLASFWREIALPSDDDAKTFEKCASVPLMGAPKPGEKLSGVGPASFGFAIASKILLMREGIRTVRVFFQYASKEEYRIIAHLGSLAHKLNQHQSSKSPKSAAAQESYIFIQLFRYMFRISLSTNDGWYNVPEYRPAYHGLDPSLPPECLAIEFDLPASVAAIVAYKPSAHGAGYDTSLPVMRFEMQQNDYYPYDILQNFLLKDIRIEVDVKSCRQLLLHNQIGQLSSLAPFMPFGPLPSVGAYLIVGYEELRYKQLINLEIKVEWAGLPRNLGGFKAHYRGYSQPLNSGDVLTSVGVLTDGKWHFDPKPINLFHYQENLDGSASNQVNPESQLSYKSIVRYQKPLLNQFKSATSQPFVFDQSTINGIFKLRLDTPENAFGHEEYPQLLSQVLTQNALLKKVALQKPLPNPPYTPQINSISLNYSAQTVLNFQHINQYELASERDKFLHLHPLGIQDIVPTEHRLISQIARYQTPANLFIGLQASQLGGILTLYFYLEEDSLPIIKRKSSDEGSAIKWWFLANDHWVALSKAQVIDDSTHGFMTSGIITLHLPDTISTDNTIMPSGIAWLRVSAQQHMEKFCSLKSVFAQAIKVSARSDSPHIRENSLPAMSIHKSLQNIPGVDHIVQIQSSFGGKSAETAQQFRTRASERLRHKNRALTSRDYELLILENFPEIFKVKCFANMCSAADASKRQRPGHILIVAIPHLQVGIASNQRPTLSGHLIYQVQEFIEKLAPTEARISVENPVYEEIQVRCTIQLDGQHKGGHVSERINQALCDYLSPWRDYGQNQHFGWVIQQHDIVSFLLDQEGVNDVSGVSMLQITQIGDPLQQLYSLLDNAAPRHIHMEIAYSQAAEIDKVQASIEKLGFTDVLVKKFGSAKAVLICLPMPKADMNTTELNKKVTAQNEKVMAALKLLHPDVKLQRTEIVGAQPGADLTPLYPWSIAVPMQKHTLNFIEHTDTRQFKPQPIGVGELKLGSTFIISKRNAS